MLERLFASKTRTGLLKRFLLHPEDRFRVPELASSLKIEPKAVKRELENLEKFGLIKTSQLGERRTAKQPASGLKPGKYYFANAQFVLFEELKALLVKAQVLYERDFIDKLLSTGKIKLLVLTGMFAGNNFSPIDLLVVGRLNKLRLLKHIKELERQLGKEINFTIMDTAEFIYRRNIADVFLYQVMEGKKIVLVDQLDS